MENYFKQLDIVALSALASKMDDKTLMTFCKTDKYFNSKICGDPFFWKRRLEEKYPLLVEFKNGTWKQFYLRMSYYISKLEEGFGIPYIPTKGYNPEYFYKEYKDSEDIFNLAMVWAAAGGGHMEIVKLLIEKGATDFDWGMNEAARGGQMEIIKLMIEKGATDFNRAMANAALGGHMEIVKFMIEKGATDFNRAMRYAAEGGHMEIVKLMIEKGATEFNWAMRSAALGGHMEILKFMIEKGATEFNLAMGYAAKGGKMELVDYLKSLSNN
jgi:Ankyrin repeats (3 copies)